MLKARSQQSLERAAAPPDGLDKERAELAQALQRSGLKPGNSTVRVDIPRWHRQTTAFAEQASLRLAARPAWAGSAPAASPS